MWVASGAPRADSRRECDCCGDSDDQRMFYQSECQDSTRLIIQDFRTLSGLVARNLHLNCRFPSTITSSHTTPMHKILMQLIIDQE
mmetsp:Transcript_59/g.120  ORF Transcript_59/g.120 Transcript_59/m.120 type:complete len:86 (+) Transcript_59:128-385(+)